MLILTAPLEGGLHDRVSWRSCRLCPETTGTKSITKSIKVPEMRWSGDGISEATWFARIRLRCSPQSPMNYTNHTLESYRIDSRRKSNGMKSEEDKMSLTSGPLYCRISSSHPICLQMILVIGQSSINCN